MIKQFQQSMIKKALANGIDESFGQKELQTLKNKIGYNPFGNKKERKIANDILLLDNWLMSFDNKQLDKYN